ncbi:MAG: hypothetical protein CVU89_15860 [Firmicutes bacterium HGW-Firmicutes-14]|nr:MAG: hypothetical protein CVU89_15860 [Firmicutes bacterium HGW-Firmicutes-14]
MKPGKFLLLIYISLTLMIVPGCWSRRELNSLSISQAIAVDLEPDGKIVLTFLFVKPDSGQKQMGGGSGSGMSYVLVSEKGETLFDTQRDIYLSLPRKLFMGQNSLVIYSEQAARAGLGPLMDLFFRHKDFRLTNYVFVTRGKASDMLKFQPNLESNPVREIFGAITYAHMRVSKTIPKDIKDFLIDLGAPGIEPVLPEIELVPKLAGEELPQSGSSGGGGPSQKTKLRLAGMAVFKEDKFVDWLSPDETRALHFAVAMGHLGIEIIPGPSDKKLAVEIIGGTSKIKPIVKNGRLFIRIESTSAANIGETMGVKGIDNPDLINELNKETENVIRERIEKLVKKAQKEYRSDFMGFGSAIWREMPQYWKEIENEWDELFTEIPVEVVVKVDIKGIGMASDYSNER